MSVQLIDDAQSPTQDGGLSRTTLVQPFHPGGELVNNSNATVTTTAASSSSSSKTSSSSSGGSSAGVLTTEDARRFAAMIQQAAERLELLGLITASQGGRRRHQPQARHRADIFSLMLQQKELEATYERLMARRNSLRGLSNKHQYLQNQLELKEITEQLGESTTVICQNLKDHPTILGNLNKIQKDCQELQQLMTNVGEDLKHQRFDALRRKVDQFVREEHVLEEMQRTQLETAHAVQMLDEELQNEWRQYDEALQERNYTIQKLTEDFKRRRKVSTLTCKYNEETALARAETLVRQRAMRLDDLRAQIKAHSDELAADSFVAAKTVDFLTRKKTALDELALQWEAKYEKDYGGLSQTFDEVTRDREAAAVQLDYLESRAAAEAQDELAAAEESERRRQEELTRRQLHVKMHLAQCEIKFYWRTFVRKRGAGKKKKKKKSKKK